MVLLAGTLVGCAGGGRRGVSAPGFGADLSASYAGQARILPGLGGKSSISVVRGKALARGDCDVAVLVTSATLRGDTARFVLEPLGVPRLERGSAQECKNPPREHSLSVSRLDVGGSLDDIRAEVDRVLQTPERFLNERGVQFNLAPVGAAGPVADKRLKASMEARQLAGGVTRPLQRLLSVAPVRRDSRKAVRYFGEVSFEAVVGADGRLRDVRVAGEFADHAERIAKALALWRYEPARRGAEPVAFRTEERTTLRIY
jgi:hypothetical protein